MKMAEENQKTPLAPSPLFPRSTYALPNNNPKPQRRPSKFLVYCLCLVVFFFIIFLIFTTVFLRAKDPKLRLTSVAAANLARTNSSSSLSNLAITGQIEIQNTNFGSFEYVNSSVSFTAHGGVIGHGSILKGTVYGKRSNKIAIEVEIGSNRWNLTEELKVGYVNLTSFAEVRGVVVLWRFINKQRTGKMNCQMRLDVTSMLFSNLVCD